MTGLVKTLLFLNVQGSVIVLVILLLKKIIRKSFKGRALRNIWLLVSVVYLLPLWVVVPENAVEPIILPYYSDEIFISDEMSEELIIETGKLPTDVKHNVMKNSFKIPVLLIWGMGVSVFLILNILGYIIFVVKKRKDSHLSDDEAFLLILRDMDITKKIRLKECTDIDSPMLVGVLFPVVYVPKKELNATEMECIYRHELTHYKHKDLLLKWFVCIVNAINWFNPMMYLVMKNLNEACEIYCDESVTKNMDEEKKRTYMNTILKLVRKE